jgi:hypothetical protein
MIAFQRVSKTAILDSQILYSLLVFKIPKSYAVVSTQCIFVRFEPRL